MCGIVGCFDFRGRPVDPEAVARMADTIVHRGPDASGAFAEDGIAFGFRRLSIIDLATGDQPIRNEDGSLVLICNGEIFNYRELTVELEARGHRFRTRSDVEVLLHLYEEQGSDLLRGINGQFSFALYDRGRRRLLLARDRMGINPLFYTERDGLLLFSSEIKALLAHPKVARDVDLTGLDQVITFPGLVPPRTMFRGIHCLEAGHFLVADGNGTRIEEYWDLDFPEIGEPLEIRSEASWVEELRERLAEAVRIRLQADVPVGFNLSGGLDSSLIGALIHQISPAPRHSFSIAFPNDAISEARYQRLMAQRLGSLHHEIQFNWTQIRDGLQELVYHSECPVKETYDTCAMALSGAARAAGVPVVLAGQGADELFGGYPGYRFDEQGLRSAPGDDLDSLLEDEIRERLWGIPDLFYEVEFLPLRDAKTALYAPELAANLASFECTRFPVVKAEKLRRRHPLHQRSYLDVKLRLSEHLLSEHGDRMMLAHSIEGRYPFLDPEVVDLARRMPADLKVRQSVEKYVLKQAATGLLPSEVVNREKFGFRAPGTPYLLQQRDEWVEDLLSYDRIKAQGYFNPDTVERLKERYRRPGFALNPHLEIDYLMIVLTFGLLVDRFAMTPA